MKLQDPISFLNLHKDKLVILDEIQRAADLFIVLRGVIDKNRERGRQSGQFLLLESASMDLLRQSSTSKDIGVVRKYVGYGGEEEFPVGNNVNIISLQKLMNKIEFIS